MNALLAGLCCCACAAPAPSTAPAKEPGSTANAREASTSRAADGTSGSAVSEHYTIVTPHEDPRLVKETALRLEAVRARLVAEFPPPEPDGTTYSPPCTVRLCSDRDRYIEAGGPAGSSCCYDANRREMVLCAEYDTAGDAALWPSLQHIAVHEYFAEALGLELHSVPPWILFGTAAVYAGMESSNGELHLAVKDAKLEELARYLAEPPPVPLAEFLAFTPAEFYGANEHNSGGRRNLVLAWSFARFLRGGSTECPEWRESWTDLVPRLVQGLQVETSGQAALDEALAEADLEALDRAWRAWLAQQVKS